LEEQIASVINIKEQAMQETSRSSWPPASADFPFGLNPEDGSFLKIK
jgi:hypothetical protein